MRKCTERCALENVSSCCDDDRWCAFSLCENTYQCLMMDEQPRPCYHHADAYNTGLWLLFYSTILSFVMCVVILVKAFQREREWSYNDFRQYEDKSASV